MSKRPVQVLLEDMREAAARVREYTKGMSEDAFLKDRRTSEVKSYFSCKHVAASDT